MGPFLKQNNLLDLLATDKISNTEYQENLEKVYQKNWLDFLSKALLVFGIAFVLSGIVFFFAFNWDKLATPEKLLVIQTGMVLSFAGFYIKQKINPLIAQTFLFSSSVLVGVFMASFGQLYQLQADSYTLFLNWALVILPWVFLTKYYSISLLFLSLVYISVSLYMLDGARMLDTHIVMVNFPIFNAFYLFSLLALVTFLRYKKSTKVSVNFLEEKLIFIALLCICIMGIYIKFRHGMVKELNAVDYVFTATLII